MCRLPRHIAQDMRLSWPETCSGDGKTLDRSSAAIRLTGASATRLFVVCFREEYGHYSLRVSSLGEPGGT
jgi:hypothetical protein